jgi:sugar phosphate permease
MVSIVNWFSRHRAKAVALSQVGYSLGGLAVPVVIICLEAFGWRTTAFYSGVMVIVVGFPLVFLVRHRPQDYGELVDGGSQLNRDGTPMVFLSGRDFTARQAMRTSSFWLISMGHACALLTVSAIMVHLVSHLTESLAYSLAQAGLVVAALTGFQMLGQIGGGFIGDRFNKQLICVVCMICHTAALFLIANATELWMVILFTAMHGLAWGIRGPLMVALRADYFGPSSFGTIMGFSSLIVMLGMSIGPIYAGYMAVIQGDYVTGFSVLGIGALLGSLCFVFARAPVHPDNDKLRGEK